MTRLILILTFTLGTLSLHAQHRQFNPERFEAEMMKYITREANLTPQEAQTFSSIYKEMRKAQSPHFNRIRQYYRTQTNDPKRCKQIIQDVDQLDIKIKQLQKTYHDKLLKALPADKVFLALKAEAQFHRKSFKKAARDNCRHKR